VICFVDNFLHFVKNSLKNNFSKPVELWKIIENT
jgi:hypothetical protein